MILPTKWGKLPLGKYDNQINPIALDLDPGLGKKSAGAEKAGESLR
jgi:hypothetical protein